MKKAILGVAVGCLVTFTAWAADQKPSEMQLVNGRGPHWQTMQNLFPYQDADGAWQYQTNTYVHLEPGLNYLNTQGQWIESKEEFELLPQGAVARQGQHQVMLPANLNGSQPVTLVQPDGQVLTSRPHGLAYYDAATGEAVLLAEIKDCQGYQIAPNQILYTDAFDDVQADVRYTYTKGGFEQDIVLKQAPPAPERYGLNSATTRLEVWSEFFEAPTPNVEARTLNAEAVSAGTENPFVDSQLDFGAMKMAAGRAFQAGTQDESAVPVAKSWIQDQGRTFLIEAVELSAVQPDLQVLPQTPGGAALKHKRGKRETALRHLPAAGKAQKKQQAAIRPATKELLAALIGPALVLDYSTLNTGSLANQSFLGDTTYYVAGALTLTGTNAVFEGGTVLKFANTNSPKIIVNTPLTWLGTAYRPVVFTARDDHSVGEKIGTGTLSGYYADTALDLEAGTANTTYTLAYLRIAYATNAIVLNQKTGHTLSHVQLVNCQNGIKPTSTSFNLRNALFVNVLTNFNGSSATAQVEHLTVDGANWFNYNTTFSTANLQVINSLLIAVTNAGSFTSTAVQTHTASGVFQTALAGTHYLADGSAYRNAGTTNISSAMLKDLATLTTYPPLALTTSVAVSQVLAPQALRDTDTPDLGYHYSSLDYYLTDIAVTNATLTLTNGVVIGVYGSNAFQLQNNAAFVSEGTPSRMNRLVRYPAVQEQATVYATPIALLAIPSKQTGKPNVTVRFTDFPSLGLSGTAGGRSVLVVAGDYFQSVSLTDCWLRGSYFHVGTKNDDDTSTASFTNNLVERSTVEFVRNVDNPHLNMTVNLWNNLWWNAALTLSYDASAFFNPTWTVVDNHFDNASLSVSSTSSITKSNNGYQNTTSLGGSGNVTLTNFPYASVTNGLGPWYHGATTLVNGGSRNADVAGLYHYTTQTSQVKETNSVVDIGFHYVAVDAQGNPLDTDRDGTPDYLEDRNGNGTFDLGEGVWNDEFDLGFKVQITEPKNGANVP